MLKGMTVTLYNRTQSGTDDFNRPTYAETAVSVDNVIVAPATESEIVDTLNLTGRRAVYQLAIPKGDTHSWENAKVRFLDTDFKVIGKPIKGIDDLIPGQWNMKVKVETYGGE